MFCWNYYRFWLNCLFDLDELSLANRRAPNLNWYFAQNWPCPNGWYAICELFSYGFVVLHQFTNKFILTQFWWKKIDFDLNSYLLCVKRVRFYEWKWICFGWMVTNWFNWTNVDINRSYHRLWLWWLVWIMLVNWYTFFRSVPKFRFGVKHSYWFVIIGLKLLISR